jgi:hypothetical protein
MIDTEVWQYPDSGKFGAIGGRQPDNPKATFQATFVPEASGVDYWHEE